MERFPPIEYLDDELKARGWTQQDLLARMPGDAQVNALALDLLRLRNPDILMGDELAEAIGAALGTSKQVWLNLDAAWREKVKA